MKKILLLLIGFTTINSFGQVFWTPKATNFSQVNRGINGISIVDDNVIWAKAYDGASNTPQNVRQFTRSIDGGNTWSSGTINLGTNQSLLNISSIHAASATTAWVSAYSDNGNTVLGGIWKTTDSGATWTRQTTALFNNASDSFANIVYFWDTENGFCQGDPVGGYFELYTTTNGGTNWTRVPSANIPAPLSGEYGYVNNYDVIGNTIWFTTNKGRIYKSTDKGLNWTVTQSPISDFGGTTVSGSLSFKDESNGLILKTGTSPLLYKTINGGTTWTQVSYTGIMGGRDLEYVTGTNTVVTVGTSADNVSFTSYSTNNGINWTQTMSGTQVTTLKFKDATLGFGGGFSASASSGGIFKYSSSVLNTDSFNSNKLAIWPNPTQSVLNFSNSDVEKIQIYDLLGKEILSKTFNGYEVNSVDVSQLNNGVYLIQSIN
ncbi:MAG: T9SS type A sorting domain-containing protein, partial [Flavobacterium sp.]